MTISVIIPTYRRPADLARCLEAFARQSRPADQIVVTVRDTDQETAEFFQKFDSSRLRLEQVIVSVPGVIAAMNAGLAKTTGDIVALIDDDGAPWPDWLAKIEEYFQRDSTLGGIGGRDWQYKNGKLHLDGKPVKCGQMNWFGRVSAGHHLAEPGPAYEVVALKGVNSAYRSGPLKAVGFDNRLAGGGAQVHWELSLGLALMRAGWRLVFDPSVAVDHFPAVRFDEDQRNSFSAIAQQNAVANETLVLYEHFRGLRRWAFVLWALLIGTRAAPGLAQVPRMWLGRKPHAAAIWLATLRGRMQGVQMYRMSRQPKGDVASA